MAILQLLYTALNLSNVVLGAVYHFLAAQSPVRLFLLLQAFLLLLYLGLAVVSAYLLSPTYTATVAIRIPARAEEIWEHLSTSTKVPLTGPLHVRTIRVSDTEWKEEIGSNEVVFCKTTSADKPKRMVRELWAESVYMKGQWIYVLEETITTQKTNKNDQNQENEEHCTVLRIYATVDAVWGSFMTPLVRLVLTCRRLYVQQSVRDHLELLCQDMGVPYQAAEVWE